MSDCIDHGQVGNTKGYGRLKRVVNGRRVHTSAHRVVYCEHKGMSLESISGLVVRHTCDNPRCINPEHLVLGTHRDNHADMVERGRENYQFGSSNHNSKLTPEDVASIRQANKDTGVGCRVLSKQYGVNRSTIRRVLRGVSYA